MNVVAIIQARMGSIRLPNKVMRNIGDFSLIEFLIKRLSKSREINKIIVATPESEINLTLINHLQKLDIAHDVGKEDDVLDRYLKVAKKNKADIIVRITGDCPLIDPVLTDEIIKEFKNQDLEIRIPNEKV